MNEEELHKMVMAGQDTLSIFEPFLDTLDGLVLATIRRGFTEEQARAIVANQFGYKPPS